MREKRCYRRSAVFLAAILTLGAVCFSPFCSKAAQDGTAEAAFPLVEEESITDPVEKETGKVDRKILERNASASSSQDPAQENGGPASYAFNGQDGNWWYSKSDGGSSEDEKNGSVTTDNPVWIQTGFDKVRQVTGLICQAKPDGQNMVKDYDVQIADTVNPSEDDFQTVKSGTLAAVTEPQTIMLEQMAEAAYIRLVVKSVQATDMSEQSYAAIMHLDVLAQAEEGEVTLENISVRGYKAEYYVGESFDSSDMEVIAQYSDGSAALVHASDVEITQEQMSFEEVGEHKLTVSYLGKTAGITVSVKNKVTEEEPVLVDLTVIPPVKTTYAPFEYLDTAGMKVIAVYSDGSTRDVTSEASIGKYFFLFEGEQTIIVSYGGRAASFTVKVRYAMHGETGNFLGIITVTLPSKKVYKMGEPLDLTGMIVTAAYYDGRIEDVTSLVNVRGYDANKSGVQTIFVSYMNKSAAFQVTVEAGIALSEYNPSAEAGVVSSEHNPSVDADPLPGRQAFREPAVQTGDSFPVKEMAAALVLAATVIALVIKKCFYLQKNF